MVFSGESNYELTFNVLDGLAINVERSRKAAINLTCADIERCAGKLTLTASTTTRSGKARHSKTESIGTAGFSIAPGGEATVKVTLDKIGRALLSAAHGHLSAILTIVRTSPIPKTTQTQRIRLEKQKGARGRR